MKSLDKKKPKEIKKGMREIIWKKGKQKCIVVAEVNGKCYQVILNKDQTDSLIFILPQLFDDHIIKISEEELPITLGKFKNL